MLTKGTGFARYSLGLCWAVSAIWLAIALLTFSGESSNSTINGVLWLLGAAAFAVSAIFMGKGQADTSSD